VNRQQKTLLIVLCGMLALVLLIILMLSLSLRGIDEQSAQQDEMEQTAEQGAEPPSQQPLSNEEMEDEIGRQAMLEEATDALSGGEGGEDLPID